MLKTAKIAAKAAGEIILKYFGKDVEFETKDDMTPVSIADREAEEKIREIIISKFPDHSINGEEHGKSGSGNTIWHVDPLDGTTNFKNGIPQSCVSIGIEQDGDFIIGVIYNPFTDEMFSAEKDKGAFLNGEKITVSQRTLSEGLSVIDSCFRGDRAKRKVETLQELWEHHAGIRMIGSNALQLAKLAKGEYVMSLNDTIKAYDVAAGIVIVREAGGIVTDQNGNSPTSESKMIFATNNKENHKIVLEIIKEKYEKYQGN